MTGEEQLKKAEAYARAAHAGQVDKGGHPYTEHLEAVAGGCDDIEAKTVGWLHDIIEDTDVTEEDLRSEGFSENVINAVVLLTKVYDENFDYYEYLSSICENRLARTVKRADLINNMDLSRLKKVSDKDLKYYEKYKISKEFLEGTLDDGYEFPKSWSKSKMNTN